MKKILGLLIITLIFSCTDDCTSKFNVYQKIESRTTDDTIIINEDTCIDGDVNFDGIVRVNGDYILTILGDAVFESSLHFVGNGSVNSSGTIIISNNTFFLGGGNIKADKGLVISGHAVDQRSDENSDIGGQVKYCNFYSIGIKDAGIVVTQDCDNITNCETLSTPSISGYRYLGTRELSCDQNSEEDDYLFVKI